jgi:hypothetical protein
VPKLGDFNVGDRIRVLTRPAQSARRPGARVVIWSADSDMARTYADSLQMTDAIIRFKSGETSLVELIGVQAYFLNEFDGGTVGGEWLEFDVDCFPPIIIEGQCCEACTVKAPHEQPNLNGKFVCCFCQACETIV